MDNSPELRSHPILDKLVTDLGNDPLALANFVLNEIDLTDAIGYNANGSVSDASINPTGVSRSALATYLEGQGKSGRAMRPVGLSAAQGGSIMCLRPSPPK